MAKKSKATRGRKANEEKQFAIVITIVATIVIGLGALLVLDLFQPLFILILLMGILLFVYKQSQEYLIQLKEYERAIIFRMGKFKTVEGPGWVILTPFIESYRIVDIRTQTTDPKEQDVVTKDDITLKVNAVAYYKILDPKKVILNVTNYDQYLIQYIEASLRNVIGRLTLEETISNIDSINKELKKTVMDTVEDWGLEIQKIELESVTLPPDIREAMHKRRRAEEQKKATAEIAQAKKLQIDAIQEAAGKLTSPALKYLYIDSLNKIADGKANKIMFPLELTNLANSLSNKLGGDYSNAQEQVLDEYVELAKTGKPKKAIIHTLQKNLKIPTEEAKSKKKKKAVEFDF